MFEEVFVLLRTYEVEIGSKYIFARGTRFAIWEGKNCINWPGWWYRS